MPLIISFSILVIIGLSAWNCHRKPDATYIAEGSDITVTLKWMEDNTYRLYFNKNGYISDMDFFECSDKYWTEPGPSFYYCKDDTGTRKITIIDVANTLLSIHVENFEVTYISDACPKNFAVKGADMIKIVEWKRNISDSVKAVNDFRWYYYKGGMELRGGKNLRERIKPIIAS